MAIRWQQAAAALTRTCPVDSCRLRLKPAVKQLRQNRHEHPCQRSHYEGVHDEQARKHRQLAEYSGHGVREDVYGWTDCNPREHRHLPARWRCAAAEERLEPVQMATLRSSLDERRHGVVPLSVNFGAVKAVPVLF